MGGVKREKGVLKLVRPGGIVEIHSTPITAAQVMERYPRHCVTRPDVFKYPWIVVRPESVLSLGRVFYVVPCHTIRHLLQSNGLVKGNHITRTETLTQAESGYDHDNESEATEFSGVDANDYHHDLVENACQPVIEPSAFRKLARESPPDERGSQASNNNRHRGRLNPKFPDGYLFQEIILSNENYTHPDDCSLMMIGHKTHKHKVGPTPRVRSKIDERELCQLKKYDSDIGALSCFPVSKIDERELCQLKKYDSDTGALGCFPVHRNVGGLEPKNNPKLATSLKPCLKKNITKKNNTQRGPRVTFMIPEEDHDGRLGIQVSDR